MFFKEHNSPCLFLGLLTYKRYLTNPSLVLIDAFLPRKTKLTSQQENVPTKAKRALLRTRAGIVGCLLGCLLAHLLACSLAGACFLACMLFLNLLCLHILICFAWLTCKDRAVEHQKLNQATPECLVFILLALAWLLLCLLDLLGLLVGLLAVWLS